MHTFAVGIVRIRSSTLSTLYVGTVTILQGYSRRSSRGNLFKNNGFNPIVISLSFDFLEQTFEEYFWDNSRGLVIMSKFLARVATDVRL